MEEKLNEIHQLIKALYPDATLVEISVNYEGIQVTPRYRTNIKGYSMKKINGGWVKKQPE